ncbi:Eukaryotic translation initiation factor 2-alpha kinase [Physocladia obscura]|uniref:Eukaryotic translation initiation factor 2-alpha kinase n=1 Tax=Physocladia obscura TaxID=109957 RepID=A0AAD5TA32_9FUNG|nr:Eukaryotic translation initiation factor 2-alpha kinase [Physocladia obscura]
MASSSALILQRLSFVSSSESNPRRSQYYSFNNDQESDKDSQHGGSRDLSDILGLYPSRYKEDFEEMRPLGKGGFGQVWCVRNRLDGVQYAVKRVKLGQRGSGVEKILREVKVQARMTHQNVVRYFSCWLEHATPGSRVASTSGDTFGDDTMESTDSVSQIFDSQQYIPCVVDAPSVGSRRFVISEMNDDDLQINIAGIEEDECIRDNGDEGEEEIEWDQDDDIDEVEFKAPDILGTEASKLSKSYTSIETASLHTAGTSPDYNPRGQKNHRFKKQHFSPIAKDDKIRDRSKNVPRELTLFIQMELCGHTLQQYLNYRNKAIFSEKFGSLCESELIDAINPSFCSSILKDMCSGLSYIHSQACIHRDIKPQNIYFVPILSNSSSSLSPCDLKAAGPFDSTNSLASSFKSAESRSVFLDDILCSPFKSGGTWKIGDFGLVTVSDSENEVLRADSPPNATKSTQSSIIESVGANSLTKSSQISMPTSGNRTSGVGTVTYASPEQLEPSTTAFYTSKSDMYSVGIVFFELLHPIGTGMERARTLSNLRLEDFPDEFLKRWPKEATHILSLLSKDPECRPSAQSTLEFLHLLKAPQGQEVQFPGRRLEKVAEKGSTLLGRYQSRRGSHKSILLETIEATIKNWIDHPHKDHPTEIASKKILDELNDPERAFKLLAAAQKRADKAEEEMKAAKEERDNLLRRINEIEKINIRKKFK